MLTDAARLDRRYVLTEWLNSADDKTHEARRISRSVAGEARFGMFWQDACFFTAVKCVPRRDHNDEGHIGQLQWNVIWLLHRLARNGDPEYIVSLSRTRLYVQGAGFVMRLCSTQLGGG